MNPEPRVSILINNYNYGRFLPDAIESALGQTWWHTEVIVVDDGSTDNSRRVLAGYGDRILSVLKENGGQASAMNAGFARSRGDIVFFLDADDVLLPHIAQRVAEVFQGSPEIARVQYRLQVVDGAGTPAGPMVPPARVRMPSGDLRWPLREFNNCTWWPPTSGNAFAAWSLRRILPIPEPMFRAAADYYLSRANALCGPIVSLEEVGASYRFHGSNMGLRAAIDLAQVRRDVEMIRDAHRYIRQVADSVGLGAYPRESTDVLDLRFLALRMVSLKLDPGRHPMPQDRLRSIAGRGAATAVRRTNISPRRRALSVVWFAAMVAAPNPVARRLAEGFLLPGTRGACNKFRPSIH